MRDLISTPPYVQPRAYDFETLSMLRLLGSEFLRSEQEISIACKLTYGLSDIVIMLERPSSHHNYELPFDDFVDASASLRGLNGMIKLATGGLRTIANVSVLDQYSFKPSEGAPEPTEAKCHDFIRAAIRRKRPQVIMCCCRVASTSGECFLCHWLCPQDVCPCPQKITADGFIKRGYIEDSPTTIVHSFHPAKVFRYNPFNGLFGGLLTYHCITAFAYLSKDVETCKCVRWAGRQAIIQARSVALFLFDITLTICSNPDSKTIEPVKGMINSLRSVFTVGCEEKYLDSSVSNPYVKKLLRHLELCSEKRGVTEVIRLILIWNGHFSKLSPRFTEVYHQLLEAGNKQKHLDIGSTYIGFVDEDTMWHLPA